MERCFILTAFGKDRPGIVADVSQLLYESGCNLEDSSMTRLMDEFATLLLFSSHSEEIEERLSEGCRRLEKEKGITAFLKPTTRDRGRQEESLPLHSLLVEGIDQAGIVYRVSKLLTSYNINIESLSSRVTPAPESGTTIYTMEIIIQIPEGTPLDKLDKDLTKTENELNVEITRSSL